MSTACDKSVKLCVVDDKVRGWKRMALDCESVRKATIGSDCDDDDDEGMKARWSILCSRTLNYQLRGQYLMTHLILKSSLNFNRFSSFPSISIPAALARLALTSLSFSISISTQVMIPVHIVTNANLSCEMTVLRYSFCLSDGVGGNNEIEDVTNNDVEVSRRRRAFGGASRTRK